MFVQLFGKYLMENNVITGSQFETIKEELEHTRVKLGLIAVADGLLTVEQADEINHIQTQLDKRFGDIAIERELLSADQIEELLNKQGSSSMKFIQFATEKGYLTVEKINEYLAKFQRENGFTDNEMKALREDNTDTMVSLLAVSAKPYVTDIAGLVLRNITRFVTTDFYFERMRKVNKYEYSYLAGQKAVGEHDLYLAFADTEGDCEGIKELASRYTCDVVTEVDNDTIDAVCEFTNMINGLFASELSDEGVDIDMLPPFAYKDQEIKGTAYILPVYIKDKHVDVFISVDEDISLGGVPCDMTVEKKEGNIHADKTKTSVLIVDDSGLSRRVLRNTLEKYGYVIVGEAVSGKEGVEEYERLRPDIVTLDITMPVMDGLEALRQIMDIDIDANVIMITAAGQQHKMVEALKAGAQEFLTKPYTEAEVIKAFNMIKE